MTGSPLRLSNLFLLLGVFAPLLLAAQIELKRPVRRYYTQIMNQQVYKQDADLGQTGRTLERNIFERAPYQKTDRIEVPVVFHILYTAGKKYPGEEQVWWQLAMLNQDFASSSYGMEHPADQLEGFSSKTSDTEISFCIAPELAGGITFQETKVEEWGPDWSMCSAKTGGSDPFDPEHYLNVWVVDLADTVSGWASYPALRELARSKPDQGYVDGIVISFDFFGQDAAAAGTALPPYNEGKTLAHLVGNYLGLYDLWNEFSTCADDYVDDTPIHNAPNYGCQEYKHVSTCHEQPAEMIMNFMDNSDDACQRMFTLGQKLRMQAMFAPGAPRAGLLLNLSWCQSEALAFPVAGEEALESSSPPASLKALRLSIWPNPARQEARLQLSGIEEQDENDLLEILIYNAQGQLQRRITGNAEGPNYEDRLQTADWPAGVYWVFARTTSGMATSRFSIQH